LFDGAQIWRIPENLDGAAVLKIKNGKNSFQNCLGMHEATAFLSSIAHRYPGFMLR
jgi:hypothetical protein